MTVAITVEQFVMEAAYLTLTCAKTAQKVVQDKLDEHGCSHRFGLTVQASVIAQAIKIRNARKSLYNAV